MDPSLQSLLPVFCLCDFEDGEKTSILGIEKGKNKDLTNYKITVAGPVKSTSPNIQFEQLKSEMAFLTDNGQVKTTKLVSLFFRFLYIHNFF
jgi:hypothetical protein